MLPEVPPVNGRNRRRKTSVLVLATAIALAATSCSAGGEAGFEHAPETQGASSTAHRPENAASPEPTTPGNHEASEQTSATQSAAPASVQIPDIGVDSPLLHLGLQADGTLEVPPTDPGSPAGWYDKSPSPGEIGPAILLGHVNDTRNASGVFGRLQELTAGDIVQVTLEDQTTVEFVVTNAEMYGKDEFPTQKVYGDTEGSEIRLITCDGYDSATGQWGDNLVVYGEVK